MLGAFGGGLSVGEPRALSLEMVEATRHILPRHKPRYAMGVGMPAELPEYVARGVDMMDCVPRGRRIAFNADAGDSSGLEMYSRAMRRTWGSRSAVSRLPCGTCHRTIETC